MMVASSALDHFRPVCPRSAVNGLSSHQCEFSQHDSHERTGRSTTVATMQQQLGLPSRQSEPDGTRYSKSVVIVGGGVSGIYAALTLRELGYTNVTIIESERSVGGKASSFSYSGKHYPIGAVGTPLALEPASFAESQLFEHPLKFAASLFGRTGRRLKVLNANVPDPDPNPKA